MGATEEHADLSIATDTLLPLEIARTACDAEGVMLAPALPFGLSEWSMAYPGTISLSLTTYCAVVHDILDSLARTGFEQIFVLNGHGFNRAIQPLLAEMTRSYPQLTLSFHCWWELDAVKTLTIKHQLSASHAGAMEAIGPARLDTERQVEPHQRAMPNLLQSAEQIRKQLGEGHGSGPVEVDEELRQALFDAAVSSFREQLNKQD